jgi:hypothetical protein
MQTIKMLIRFLMLIPLASGIVACSGGGDGAPPVPNNLSATALQVMTPDPKIAYPLKVSVSITADVATVNVSVSLFAIEKNDDPAVEVRQIPLGSQTIPLVDAGARSYEVEINIPSSVELPGEYFIAAIVDPVEEVAETNEDDNTASVETTLSVEGTPNILLMEVALDRSALLINTDDYAQQVPGTVGNVHNADAGGTITVGADGLAVNETIDIEAFARLRLMRSDTGTSHDVPLYLWNSEQARYINAYGVDPAGTSSGAQEEWLPLGQFTPQLVETAGEDVTLNDIDRNSAHLNFYFPGKLGSELEQAMRYPPQPCTGNCTKSVPLPTIPPPDLTAQAIDELKAFLSNLPFSGTRGDESAGMAVMDFAICVEIRPVDSFVVDLSAEDNELCSALALTLPPIDSTPPAPVLVGGFQPRFSTPSNPLTSGDGFPTKGGGSTFRFGLDFGATATADNRGYIEEMRGAVPVTIFGRKFDFMSTTVRAQMVPDYAGKPATEESGYTVEMRFLGAMLSSVDLPPGSPPAVSISFSKDAPDPELEKEFFVGPVPMVAGASVAGNFGIEYEFVFTVPPEPAGYTFGNTVSPFVNIEATMFAGVGNRLFSAGVEGVLTLLDERLTLFSGTEIEVLDLGFGTGPAEFVITQGQKITNVFTGPRGALNLFAKYSVPKLVTCSWGFFKGKCIKTRTIKATKNIWRSPALFTLKDVLYEDKDVQFDVVVMQGQPPMYFVP